MFDDPAAGQQDKTTFAVWQLDDHQVHSYFSREYKSVFGAPPLRDIQRLREVGSPAAG